MATYKWRCLRFKIVPIKFQPNATQITAIAMSKGHSNSAYSLEVVIPSGKDIAAPTMMSCHPQKLMLRQRNDVEIACGQFYHNRHEGEKGILGGLTERDVRLGG